MKLPLRTFVIENVIWADFRPRYRSNLSLNRSWCGRFHLWRFTIRAPQQIGRIGAKRLTKQYERSVLNIPRVTGLPFVNGGLRQGRRRAHRD